MAANLNTGILHVLYLTASPIPSATQRWVILFHTGSFSDQKADCVSLCVQQVQMNSFPGSPCSKHTSGWGPISLESRSVAITASGWWYWAQGSTLHPMLGLPNTEDHFPVLCCWQGSPGIWHASYVIQISLILASILPVFQAEEILVYT